LRVSYIAGKELYLSIYLSVRRQPLQESRNVKFSSHAAAAAAAAVEAGTSRNTNSLHAVRQLLHRGVKLLLVNVTIFLSGLRQETSQGLETTNTYC
jgi:hypothetical protein